MFNERMFVFVPLSIGISYKEKSRLKRRQNSYFAIYAIYALVLFIKDPLTETRP